MPDVHPDLAAAGRLPPITFSRWTVRLLRPMVRLLRPPVDLTGVDIVDTETPSALGPPVEVRVYLPAGIEGPLPVLVWLHGGGYVVGDHRDDRWGALFARALGIAVASVSYRLAPEHPFPAALDDAARAMAWVRTGGYGRFDPDRVAVGGESAGGGLAAALVQRLHDEGMAVAAQWLVYPMLDDRTAARTDIGASDHLVWNNGSNRFGWSSYLGTEPGAPDVPDHAVPARRDDLSGLPPTWIVVGDIDLFHDEDVAYAERLREAGVDCHLEVVPGGPHGFAGLGMEVPIVSAALETGLAFLDERL